MSRCECGGYLIHEPEIAGIPPRVKCMACGWMLSDPNFRKDRPTYFPSDAVDNQIEWKMQYPGYDLYYPKSAAAQLGISESFLRYSVKSDASAPMIWGRGMIACKTPVLQEWWDKKKHHA